MASTPARWTVSIVWAAITTIARGRPLSGSRSDFAGAIGSRSTALMADSTRSCVHDVNPLHRLLSDRDEVRAFRDDVRPHVDLHTVDRHAALLDLALGIVRAIREPGLHEHRVEC